MKYFFLIILWAIGSFSFAQTELNVIRANSKVTWTGTKVIGYHQGIVKIKEGKVKVRDGKLTGGYFVIDMTTITCTDIPDTDPIPKKKLENHLKDADFFDVNKYPTAKFEIIEVRNHPDDPTRLLALGNLTIKGITKRWKIEVEPIAQTEKAFMAQAHMQFDRQLFGVAYTGIKDELVHDLIKLNIVIKAE